jgi:hypothetical protein
MDKRITVVLGILILVAMARFGFAQEMETQNRTMVAEGTIMSVDWVGDKIFLDGGDEMFTAVDDGQLELVMTDDVKVMKRADASAQTELEQGMHVKVEYVVLSDGTCKAKNILITDPA